MTFFPPGASYNTPNRPVWLSSLTSLLAVKAEKNQVLAMVSLSSREEMVWEGSSNSTVCPHHRAGSQSDANVPSLTFSTSACLPYWSSENKTHVKLNLILQGGLSADLDLGTEILEPLFLMSYSTDKDAIQLIKSQREKPQQVSVTRSKANPQHGSADYNVLNRKILIEKNRRIVIE